MSTYILHKNDTPPWAYKPELPAHIPELPPCFTQPGSSLRAPGSVRNEKLHLESLDSKWENSLETESQTGNNTMVISRFRRIALKLLQTNPFVPFTLRGTVFVFSVVGLGLAARIFILTKLNGDGYRQQPSVIMALVVLSVAIVYLSYSTYNEYFGQPLGLRSAPSKMMFIMVDLIFIIFASSNLSLAFNTLFDQSWICKATDAKLPSVCERQRDLVGVLFVSLCFWLATFSVSLFRMVDKAAS